MYQVFLSSNALAPSKKAKIVETLHNNSLPLTLLDTKALFLVQTQEKLTEKNRKTLEELLQAQAVDSVTCENGFIVTPRLGTISPWSTQASQAAKICGLTAVQRIEQATLYLFKIEESLPKIKNILKKCAGMLSDRMTQSILYDMQELEKIFRVFPSQDVGYIPLMEEGINALEKANISLGLALSKEEMDYLFRTFKTMQRNPTDAELMMFAQANSEHCRHKIFNAKWTINGNSQAETLFGMIRYTSKVSTEGLLIAYNDNAAVIEGAITNRFFSTPENHVYHYSHEPTGIVIKVETHNHPTAVSPFPGAATGAGGEIRDEGATGRGAKPKAGLVGYAVADLGIPHFTHSWEVHCGKPAWFSSALDIMLEAPIGAARFNNEFGRPNIVGFFRTLSARTSDESKYIGYLKPIMLAGGMGTIRLTQLKKLPLPEKTPLIVIGGPAMLIGLGGGAASSLEAGAQSEELDFASVQRGNPEMQRRCQEVIDACWALGDENPILSIHDVGAGGLSNAFPELVETAGCGAQFDLRKIPSSDPSLSPLALWSNESQERYVLAIKQEYLDYFEKLCKRERCPYAIVGSVVPEQHVTLTDSHNFTPIIDLPTQVIVGNPLKMEREGTSEKKENLIWDTSKINLEDAIKRVLQHPTVADKSFLITIGDRSVGGLVSRDQMVGPWQVPVADVGVTASGFKDFTGEAMAVGERTPIAMHNAVASARIAVGEAITNIAAARIGALNNIKLSANWMAAVGSAEEEGELFNAVKVVAKELCPELGIAIPVGKDSLSMRARWDNKEMRAPLSLIISAFAPVSDIRNTLTPELDRDFDNTQLILIDLGLGKNRIGGSILSQVFSQYKNETPDLDSAQNVKAFFEAIQELADKRYITSYHDRSDGGLLASLCEMSFATRCGLHITIPEDEQDPISFLFNEELGAVIQIHNNNANAVFTLLEHKGLAPASKIVARATKAQNIIIESAHHIIYKNKRAVLQQYWSETSCRMQALRDNPVCAERQFEAIREDEDPGLNPKVNFDFRKTVLSCAPELALSKPKIAILREQGVNGHIEMAAAFENAGFTAVDVVMQDLIAGTKNLSEFRGLAACGGFSYGDVLGAGRAWAMSILLNERLKDEFARFFARPDTFTLGVCNGCQMLSQLRDFIPGAAHWPRFIENRSEQFEARLSLVKIASSSSLFFTGMEGSVLPVVVSHGEGYALFDSQTDSATVLNKNLVAMQYVDNQGNATQVYPNNPNGSAEGITGLTNESGRVTILMPHPERVFRGTQLSWRPKEWDDRSPWARLFENARHWVG